MNLLPAGVGDAPLIPDNAVSRELREIRGLAFDAHFADRGWYQVVYRMADLIETINDRLVTQEGKSNAT